MKPRQLELAAAHAAGTIATPESKCGAHVHANDLPPDKTLKHGDGKFCMAN